MDILNETIPSMAKVANMMTGDKLFRIGSPTPKVKVLKTEFKI